MRKNNAGFTLIEILIVIAIIGIAAAIGMPQFLKLLPNWRAKSAATDLLSNTQLAKLTAIRRGTNCVITFSGDPDAATPSQYTISIINKTVQLDGYGSQLAFRGPIQGSIYPRFEGDTIARPATWTLTFNSRGMVTGNAFNTNIASLEYTDTDPERTYYRAGATTAGVVQMQRYDGSIWK